MAKKIPKHRTSTKIISLTSDNFQVHKLAKKPYQIFCEYFPSPKIQHNQKIVSSSIANFDVIQENGWYFFFDNFKQVPLLADNDKIIVRQLAPTNIDIERRAWGYLLNEFLLIEPVNPAIYNAIKTHIPLSIAQEIFGQKLTIKKILDLMLLEQHHYAYRHKQQKEMRPHVLPKFSQLIAEVQEVQNDA